MQSASNTLFIALCIALTYQSQVVKRAVAAGVVVWRPSLTPNGVAGTNKPGHNSALAATSTSVRPQRPPLPISSVI